MAKLTSDDRKILAILHDDGRASFASIAERLGLSEVAVRRRVKIMERDEVIKKFTAVLNHEKTGPALEAYIELWLTTRTPLREFERRMIEKPEIRELSTIVGDIDAIMRVRVDNQEHLKRLIEDLRDDSAIERTQTRIALGRVRSGVREHLEPSTTTDRSTPNV